MTARRPRPETSVAVVGAGPVGLAAALVVSAAGYRVALVAPDHAPTDQRTSALLAGSVELLERLGVWQGLAAQSAPLRTMRIVDGTRRLIRAPEVAFDASEVGLDAFGHNIPNAALVAALETAVAARTIDRVTAFVERVAPGDDAVTLSLPDGVTLNAQLVIAADGRRSKVREGAGIAVDDWRYDQAALVCNLRHSLSHHDSSTEFHTEGGPFTLVPLPGDNRSSLVWVDRPAESQRRLSLDDDALAAEIEERSASILGAVEIDGKRQVFPLSGMTARHFADQSRHAGRGSRSHVPTDRSAGPQSRLSRRRRARRRAGRTTRRPRRTGRARRIRPRPARRRVRAHNRRRCAQSHAVV